ncbi:MAG: protein kinase [Micrococcales bacterium]|nr:protein kinase [Micrococcales bacterium]
MSAEPTVLADRYELGAVLGHGGMAQVCLARDLRLGRQVAVKMMRDELVDRADFVTRFSKEARAVAALNHPTVVAVYDSGEAEVPRPDGTVRTVPYIVMEYVEGRSLKQLLDEGSLSLVQALDVTGDVLTALEQAHDAGLVHRDIKPSNVMVTTAGAVKVMDFGIARVVADATMTTTVLATPHYMSPEQARGERVDARSDLYSVGCMLFELLAARPPFVGENSMAVMFAHVNTPPPQLSSLRVGLPGALDQVVTTALAKNRDERYQTAAQFRAAVEAVARGENPPVGPALAVAPPVPVVSVPGRGAAVPSAGSTPAMRQPVLAPGLAIPGPTVLLPPGSPRPVPPPLAPGVANQRRVAPWLVVGALVVMLLVAAAVMMRSNNDNSATPPTMAAQDEDPHVGDQQPGDDHSNDQTATTPAIPSREDNPGSTQTLSRGEVEARMAPPAAGSPSRQEQTVGNQVTAHLAYQSRDSIDRLVEHYRGVLGPDATVPDRGANDRWTAYGQSGGWDVSVTLVATGSGTSVVVTLSGAG